MRSPLLLSLVLLASCGNSAVVFLQAEDFRYRGDWRRQAGEPNALGEVLINHTEASALPAVAAVEIPQPGPYRLMVRARDFPNDRPGIRRFAVEVNGQRAEKEFGAHGNPDEGAQGWAWEDGGLFNLPGGPVVVALIGLTSYARCDAICLVSGGDDVPRTMAEAQRAGGAWRPVEVADLALPLPPAAPVTVQGQPLAVLRNEHCEVAFSRCDGPSGPTVAMRLSADGKVLSDWTAEAYRLLRAPDDVQLVQQGGSNGQWPGWTPTHEFGCRAGLDRIVYPTSVGDGQWIVGAGEPLTLYPAPDIDAAGGLVRLTARGEAGRITATWSLPAQAANPRLTLRFEPAAAGTWGLGYSLGYGRESQQLKEVLCPYLYQYQRWPEEPRLITTEIMPTPMGVYTTEAGTYGLVLDPAGLDRGWPDVRELEQGLQMAEPGGLLRPSAWGPFPGGQGARLKAGQPVELKLAVVATPQDSFGAWQQVASDLFGLRDYRHNRDISLTQAALNAMRLMKDDKAGGWSAEGQGFWNIESDSTVTNAAPLAVLSAALLTGDESLLEQRAVPTLANMMSRPSTHFQIGGPGTGRIGNAALGQAMTLYGAPVRYGAEAMCHGYLSGYDQFTLNDQDKPYLTRGYGKQRPFEDYAAAFRATGRTDFREQMLADLEAYLKGLPRWAATSPPPSAFYQLSYTGNFEGLLDVADLVDDPRVLAEATRLARTMITGFFTNPPVQPGTMVCHPDGTYEGNGIRWWTGTELFALGFPPLAPEAGDGWDARHLPPAAVKPETVDAWVPSIVGLGIEQPTTYRRLRCPCAAIMMSNWAPKLLRLAAKVDEPAFTVAAHNAMLGRFGNYPGYYATGFTPLTSRADYPYTGPDVSGLYYHHIPPFLANLIDYLVADVEVRSKGAITFPSERQMGYAWFDNRVYGHAPGQVYETKGAWPWLRDGLVAIDNPRLNWFAAHTADTVFVMLTNTGFDPVSAAVRLDPAATGGAAGPVSARVDNGPAQALARQNGAVRVEVPSQGLVVLTWQGCRVDVPFHRTRPRPAAAPATPVVKHDGGQVRSGFIGVDPEHVWLHVYSDHDGSKYQRATLVVTQGGQTRSWQDAAWPLEFIVPVTSGQEVTARFTAAGDAGESAAEPFVAQAP